MTLVSIFLTVVLNNEDYFLIKRDSEDIQNMSKQDWKMSFNRNDTNAEEHDSLFTTDNLYRGDLSVFQPLIQDCEKRLALAKPGTIEYRIIEADCGTGYQTPSNSMIRENGGNIKRKWRVYFIGSFWSKHKFRLLSGKFSYFNKR